MKATHHLLFFSSLFFSCIQILNAKVEIISLGSACNVARSARLNNLRDTAYPFDWLISSFDAVMAGFEDDFAQLLVPEQTREREDGKAVIDGYGFIYIHDFPTVKHPEAPEDGEIMPVHQLLPTWRDSIDIVKAKFTRRLNRLYDALNSGKPIALVRYYDNYWLKGDSCGDFDASQAEQFMQLLERKFPNARVILVAIGATDNFKTPRGLPHVHTIYMEPADFKAWDGPVWAQALQAIAALEPVPFGTDPSIHFAAQNTQGERGRGHSEAALAKTGKLKKGKLSAKSDLSSKDLVNTEKPVSYLLTWPAYGPGLFSAFNTVLGALDLYDRGLIAGLEVNFEDQGWYYDAALGHNWWSYYFEPIKLENKSEDHEFENSGTKELFSTYHKIDFAYRAQFEFSRERAHELIQKYIRVRPHITQIIDNFWNKNFAQNQTFVIGVHYRGSDKIEAESVSHEQVTAQLQAILENKENNKPIKIFVATDDQNFASYIKKQFPDLVIMRDVLRTDNMVGVHMRSDLAAYRKGEEVIIDCLLLSRCSLLIKTASNVSDCSLQFNPSLPVTRLNRSFSE